ncbi:18784_t:CDS:2 [Entrophospora sp. SA101]|nr:18784_t:CDS:2 [Entrophospora sp. SA101]
MKYVMAIINKYDYYNSERLKNIFEIEKLYDSLSIVKRGENFNLQGLLSGNKLGMYHRYCLFASYPGVWNSVKADIIPDENKYLGITTRKVKNLQTRDQFNLWRNNIITMYKKEKNFDMLYLYQRGYEYEEYYIPGDWISFKKHQLQQRLSNHLKELLKEQGYRVVCGRSWYVMVKWIENPDYYANLTYPNIVRI